MPLFAKTMPRDRLLNILCCFHLNDNTLAVHRAEDGYDALFKVRPLYDVTRDKFLTVYTPTEHLSLDEAMVPWKGGLSFRQYIPSKPDRFGVKLYVLCEATPGYISGYDVYTGKDYDPDPDADDNGHSHGVVMGMMSRAGLLNQGYSLYTDTYYTSPTLCDNLHAEGTALVGTVRTNRKEVPKALKLSKLRKGEAIVRQRDNLLALKWKDKRDVGMLSTKHSATFSLTNRVEQDTGDSIAVPTCIVDYNKYMGGVDLSDQLSKYYNSIPLPARLSSGGRSWRFIS